MRRRRAPETLSRLQGALTRAHLRKVVQAGGGGFGDLLLSPQGNLVAATRPGLRRVLLVDLTGSVRARLGPFDAGVRGAMFAPDGERVWAWDEFGSLRAFDLDGTEQTRIETACSGSPAAVIDPVEGAWIAIVSAKGTAPARVWSADGSHLARLARGEIAATAVGVLPDDSRIIAGDAAGALTLWQPDGTDPITIRSAPTAVEQIEPATDGSWIGVVHEDGHVAVVTPDRDGTARFWTTDVEELLELADARTLRDFTAAERERWVPLLDE